MNAFRNQRKAFTLLELLVVVGIIVVLASLTAAFLPSLRQSNNAAKAAQMVQGQLSLAKMKAMRDHGVRGIRLIPNEFDPTVCTEIAFVEQPPDLGFSTTYYSSPIGILSLKYSIAFTINASSLVEANILGDSSFLHPPPTASVKSFATETVELGDYLQAIHNGNVYTAKIIGITAAKVTLDKPLSPLMASTVLTPPTSAPVKVTDFKIIRKVRPLAGEETVQLPPNMTIDLKACNPLPPNPILTAAFPAAQSSGAWYALNSNGIPTATDFYYEVMFNSSGSLAASSGRNVILYVRPLDGKPDEHAVIAVHSSTGQIVVHPVGPTGSPYLYTTDGKGSGL
jgi:prepilin-type N-terminal cleavage/methylation domain-containing protein